MPVLLAVVVQARLPSTLTCTALLTFVALGAAGNRLKVPPLDLDTDAERKAEAEAFARRTDRLARKGQGAGWLALLG